MSPERKIWLRPCNGCGFELHVRRTRCTACGVEQVSKRAALNAKEEAARAERQQLEAQRMAQEAEDAASSLKAISQLPSPAKPVVAAAAAAVAADEDEAPPAAEAPVIAAPETTGPTSAAATATRAQAISAAMARLSPEARTKLKRLHKLRALLANVPAGVQATLGASGVMRAAASGGGASDDAIAMLASVACR